MTYEQMLDVVQSLCAALNAHSVVDMAQVVDPETGKVFAPGATPTIVVEVNTPDGDTMDLLLTVESL